MEPYDKSPVDVPAGWSGGTVWHTGGNIWMRSWYNTPNGRPASGGEPDEYIEVGYNGDLNGVSASRYEQDEEGRYHYAEVVAERSADDGMDEHDLAALAADLMRSLDA